MRTFIEREAHLDHRLRAPFQPGVWNRRGTGIRTPHAGEDTPATRGGRQDQGHQPRCRTCVAAGLAMDANTSTIRLGLRENLGQFSFLVLINVFVGMMVGLERTVVPLIGEREFGLVSKTAIVSFIVSFGVTKAICNLFAARVSETIGRKKVLVAGWLVGLPVPFIIIFARHWYWFDVANVLLGVNQALCWSMTVIMKVDLVGPKRRGFALGLNDFAGYLAVAFSALATGEIASRFGLRPEPFYLGIGVAFAGLLVSLFLAKETRHYATLEANLHHAAAQNVDAQNSLRPRSLREIFALASWKDRNLF